MENDPRYKAPVAGLKPDALAAAMRKSIDDVQANFPPKTGVIVFAFDFGDAGGGMSYIANAERASAIAALREWINHQSRQS